jgi:putative transposase
MQAPLRLLALIVRCIPAFFRSHREQVIVELALRQQLATYDQQKAKPRLTPLDRAFWVMLSRFWPGWKRALVIVQPDTVVRWHRRGFRLY